MHVYTASCILPVASAPLRDGAVAVEDGRVAAVGSYESVVEAVGPDIEVRDLGNAAVLPGLVNAHTHVELSWLGDAGLPRGDYLAWIRALLERRAEENETTALDTAERALGEMARRGTVAIGDVANGTWVVPLLARSSLHVVSFHEIYEPRAAEAGRTMREASRRLEKIARNADVRAAGDRLRLCLTPHAPHTTSSALLRAIAEHARTAKDPLSIHLAESGAEAELLRDGTGPFAELFRERGIWDDDWTAPGLTPTGYLDRLGVLESRTLAVHCVRMVHEDHSRLQSRQASVVTCPRSNRDLGVGRAPVRELLGEGIPVALGTDSLASVEDLDMFAEMAALREEHPELAPAAVLRMATLNGATALGLADRLGSIETGKLARLVVVPLADGAVPLDTLCSNPPEVHLLEDAPSKLLDR